MNKIQEFKPKVHFKLKEGSNYKLVTSYKDEYIVEYDLFKKIAKALFNASQDFITVYETILNKKYIYAIEPTPEQTLEQKKESKRERDLLAEEIMREEVLEQTNKFDEIEFVTKHFNEKYGLGKWCRLKPKFVRNDKHNVDMKELWDVQELYRKSIKLNE